jgi:hypothetical protein
MAAWLTVFRTIPWMELIAAAPAIVRGARKLWSGMRKSPQPGGPAGTPLEPQARLQQLESQVNELTKELAASAEIIRAMAEQNERLVEAVGILRARVRVLMPVCVLLVVLGIALAVKVWTA